MTFDESFEILLGHEGGFTKDPNDRGNWTSGRIGVGVLKGTKFGISAAAFPSEDIENLTATRAKAIYHHEYWAPAGCDAVPAEMKFDLFDAAVNSGVTQAVRFLQLACGASVDGKLGPKTLMAVQSTMGWRLVARFNGHRLDFLNNNPDQWALYGRGWSQRIAENLMRA